MASTEPGFAQQKNHIHIPGEICPLCDQSIPADKLVEIQQRERSRAERQTEALRKEFNRDKAAALKKQNAEIASIRLEADKKSAAELAESKKREDVARIEAAAEERKNSKIQLDKFEAEKKKAEEQFKLQQELATKNAAIAASKDAQIESIQREKIEAVKLEQMESKKREEAAKVDAKAQAENATKEKLLQMEKEKKAAEDQVKNAGIENKKELDAQREALEKSNLEAIQKEQSNSFAVRQKFESQLADLQRQLKNKTADELGEAAEFELIDELKSNFSGDVYKPIDKGVAGADLWQDVMHNGIKCGRIVFDSKNRESWRNDYVSKLKTDQLNADGDHAVLTTRKFPAGKNQLHIQGGVIVSHPARVIALVSILREQIIHVHRLNASNNLRGSKTEELYEFINSERCGQLFDNFDNLTEELLELDVTEINAHKRVWKKRGEIVKKTQRTILDQLRGEIDRIIIKDEPS